MKLTLQQAAAIARRSPGFWYLASPYTNYPAGKNRAFTDVSVVGARLLAENVAVFCPIAQGHVLEAAGQRSLVNKAEAFWLETVDEPLMRASVGMILACMDGWEKSSGVGYELRHFAEAGKPIIMLDVSDILQPRAVAPNDAAAELRRKADLGSKLGGGSAPIGSNPSVISMKHTGINAAPPLQRDMRPGYIPDERYTD